MSFFREFLAKKVFGVSAWWGDFFGVRPSFIRLLFIYASFTNIITILIYLAMALILYIRNYFKHRKRKSVFDL